MLAVAHRLRWQVARRPRPLRLLACSTGVVVLAEHLHIAAQRQNADAVFGFTPLHLGQLQASDVEADVKLLALHTAGLGHQKVAQLVHEDHEAQPRGHLQDHPPARRLNDPLQPAFGKQHAAACDQGREHSKHRYATHRHSKRIQL